MALVFNEQQKDAIAKAVAWYNDVKNDRLGVRQFFFLAGYAGVGKTSVANQISALTAGAHKTVFIAPTGKAASRLREKGCAGARTYHQFIYRVAGENEDGDPIFVDKTGLDESPDLLVLDEGSMVSEWDFNKLLERNIPILALGDPGQVPPVKGRQFLAEGVEDVLLTEIMRQDAESNIIRAATFVRQGKRIPPREYHDVQVRLCQPTDDDVREYTAEDAVMICALNSTRTGLNERARRILGHKDALPEIGEKVVCTFNQHSYGFMNGEQAIVQKYSDIPSYDVENAEDDAMLRIHIKSLTDGKNRIVRFNPKSFDANADVRKEAQKAVGGFDFGYALTVHKSQGSEWPKVMIVEETLRGAPYEKMMYTAFTRAQKNLRVYRRS